VLLVNLVKHLAALGIDLLKVDILKDFARIASCTAKAGE